MSLFKLAKYAIETAVTDVSKALEALAAFEATVSVAVAVTYAETIASSAIIPVTLVPVSVLPISIIIVTPSLRRRKPGCTHKG